jgi:hypothetical protein
VSLAEPVVFDLSTRCFNGSFSAFSDFQTFYGHSLVDFAGQDHTTFDDFFTDDVSRFKSSQIHHVTFNFHQLVQADFGHQWSFARVKAELRQTTVNRHLTAFKTWRYFTA